MQTLRRVPAGRFGAQQWRPWSPARGSELEAVAIVIFIPPPMRSSRVGEEAMSRLGLEEAPAHLGRAVQVSGAQTINNYPAIFFQKKKQRRSRAKPLEGRRGIDAAGHRIAAAGSLHKVRVAPLRSSLNTWFHSLLPPLTHPSLGTCRAVVLVGKRRDSNHVFSD